MFTLRTTTISFLLIAALIFSSWSILISTRKPQLFFSPDKSQPDGFMENVVATILNKEGHPSLKVVTPQMVHYYNNDMTLIMKPNVTVYRDTPQPWFVHANFARATGGTDRIFFWDDVLIDHPADTSNPVTTMTTTSLTVFPNQQLAETDQPVVIKQPDTIVHAIGMLANLNDGTVRLLSQAQGEYVPSSPQK